MTYQNFNSKAVKALELCPSGRISHKQQTEFQQGILMVSAVLKAQAVVFTLNLSLTYKAICKSFRERKVDRHRRRNELNTQFLGCPV